MRSERSRWTNLKRVVHRPSAHSTTPGLTGSRVPATGPRRSRATRPRPELVRLVAVLRDHLLAPAEVGTVRPHAMEDAGQLACQGHLRPFHAAAPGNLQSPALEGRDAGGPGQHHVGCLVEGGAHHPIPNFAEDRKSTRLNSSHANISYAVFCLK